MTEGEKIAATTSWKTNRADLSRLIDSAIDTARQRAFEEAAKYLESADLGTREGHAAAIRQLGGSGK